MNVILSFVGALRGDRKAVTALEYGLIAAVVVVAGLAGFSTIGTELANKFSNVETSMSSADGTGAASPAPGGNGAN